MTEKKLFLSIVEKTVANHPEWFSDVVLAMQSGLVKRIDTEQKEKANLAYALAFFVQHAPETAKKGGPLPSAYITLAKFFNGAPIARDINQLIYDGAPETCVSCGELVSQAQATYSALSGILCPDCAEDV